MSQRRIVATAPIDEIAVAILEAVAPVEVAPSPDEEAMMGLLEGTVGLVVRGEGKATAGMIEAAEDLAVIGRPGVGYDSVDLRAATARKIPLVYAPVGGFAVAEGALALLLTLVKKIPLCDEIVKRGEWQRRYEVKTGDMTEHTLGIIGLGRIGRHLARLATPFGMTILGSDPYVASDALGEEGIEVVALDALLERSDYISTHTPLTDETRGLINRDFIAKVKPGAILINTSRGDVVESLDILADALDAGRLNGLGLDVFPDEPPDSNHRIFRDPRCICAPHLVGMSEVAMDRIFRSMAEDMVAVLQGRRPDFCVNPEVLGHRLETGQEG